MRISVIMGVYYKKPDTAPLRRAVESILDQTFTDFELLIDDDGSSEEALRVIDAIAESDKRVVLLRGSGKFSLPEKLNHCLLFAKGKYIARMDDDDFSMPDRFEVQASFLDAHREFAFVGSNVTLIRNGETIGNKMFPESPSKDDFKFMQPFVHPALMFRKDVIDIIGGYSEKKEQILCEDYDLLLRLYERGFLGYNIQRTLLEYTLPPIGKSSRRFRHRINEVKTRYERFKALGMLPGAFPYVVKPLVVGLIPQLILDRIKKRKADIRGW